MADYGLKITKSGYDVSNAAIKDQIFNSSANSFKIVAQGTTTISVPASGSATYVTVAHGLSYTPAFLAFCQLSDSSMSFPPGSYGLTNGEGFYAYSDSSNLGFGADPYGTAYTAYIYYYIIGDPSL